MVEVNDRSLVASSGPGLIQMIERESTYRHPVVAGTPRADTVTLRTRGQTFQVKPGKYTVYLHDGRGNGCGKVSKLSTNWLKKPRLDSSIHKLLVSEFLLPTVCRIMLLARA
jgi:hypothetical protein